MDDSSSSDGESLFADPTVASILGIKGSLRFRPHGSNQKAHVVLRRVEISDDSDDDGESKSVVYFSLFAQKRIEVKPGKEILLAVSSPDGTFKDQPVIFEGDVPSDDDLDTDEEEVADTKPEATTIPPKMRRTWSKRVEENHTPSDTFTPPPRIHTSVAIQVGRPSVSKSVQVDPPSPAARTSTATQALPIHVSASVQTILTPPHVLSPSQAVDSQGTASADDVSTEHTLLDSDIHISNEWSEDASRVPKGRDSPSVHSQVDLLSDMDQGSERSLSPMDLDSPSSSPPQSPVVPDIEGLSLTTSASISSLSHVTSTSVGVTSLSSQVAVAPSPQPSPASTLIRVPSLPGMSRQSEKANLSSPSLSLTSPIVSSVTPDTAQTSSFSRTSVTDASLTSVGNFSKPLQISLSPHSSLSTFAPRVNLPKLSGEEAAKIIPSDSVVSPQAHSKRKPVVSNPFVSAGFMTEFVGGAAAIQPVKVIDMKAPSMISMGEPSRTNKMTSFTQPPVKVGETAFMPSIPVTSPGSVTQPVASTSSSVVQRSDPHLNTGIVHGGIVSNSKSISDETSPPALSTLFKSTDGGQKDKSPASPPGLTYRRLVASHPLPAKPSREARSPAVLRRPPNDGHGHRPSSPPPNPKSLAVISSGPLSNPLNIRPSSSAAAKRIPANAVGAPLPAVTSAAKKRVVVGSGWPYTRHTPTTTTISGPSSNSPTAVVGSLLPIPHYGLGASSPPKQISPSPTVAVNAINLSSVLSHQIPPLHMHHSPSSHYGVSHEPSLSPTTPPGLSHIVTYSPSPPPSSNASSSGQPSKSATKPDGRQASTTYLNGLQSFPNPRDTVVGSEHPILDRITDPYPNEVRNPPPAVTKLEPDERGLPPRPTVHVAVPVNGTSRHTQESVSKSSVKQGPTPTHPLPPKPLPHEPNLSRTSRGVKRGASPHNERVESMRPPKRSHRWPTMECIHSIRLKGDGKLSIHGIAFNSDGSQFAVNCYDRTIRIWNNLNHTEIARLSHHSPIVSSAWMDGDAGIMSLGEDGVVSKWTRTGQNHWQWAKMLDTGCERRPDEDPMCLAYMRDRIAVSFPRIGVKVWMWVKGTWQPQRSILRQNVTAIKFVEDGDALLGGTRDGVLWYCQVPNGTLRAYTFFKSKVYSIEVTSSSTHALVGQAGGRSHLVGIKQDDHKGKIEQVYATKDTESQPKGSNDLAAVFSSRGNAVLFGSVEGCLLVWDRMKGDIIYGLDHGEDDDIQAVGSFDQSSSGINGHLITGTKQGYLYWWSPPPIPRS